MRHRDGVLLAVILVVVLIAAWVAWPANPGIHIKIGSIEINRDISVHLGLDLRGGMRVLLEAAPPPGEQVTADAMSAARSIIENRVNGLGVTEPVVQSVGQNRISVELPGIQDPEQAIATFRETGLLEFVDVGYASPQKGDVLKTSYSQYGTLGSVPQPTPTTPSEAPTGSATGTDGATPAPTQTPQETVYPTILTGKHLKSADVGFDERGAPEIDLEFTAEGAKIFADYTANNIGKTLAITMDQEVISAPRIQASIPDGKARITSSATSPFTLDEVKGIVIQLKYGALPVPLQVIQQQTIGPTLGQDSINSSIKAGAIGLMIVLFFMLSYYRLPGALADVALLIYATLTFAVFKLIPVTLTLPGIAGFLLSIGSAVDANILIFERIKEELRHGRPLSGAVEAGFNRAFTAIWDSNLAIFITCLILWIFGNTYGASIVKGFAVTLFIGVAVSMFTAVTVTHTFLRVTFRATGERIREKKWLLGV